MKGALIKTMIFFVLWIIVRYLLGAILGENLVFTSVFVRAISVSMGYLIGTTIFNRKKD